VSRTALAAGLEELTSGLTHREAPPGRSGLALEPADHGRRALLWPYGLAESRGL